LALRAMTARELVVPRWLSAGKTDRDMGEILGCSCRTIYKHLQPWAGWTTARPEVRRGGLPVAGDGTIAAMSTEIAIVRPDDAHLHVRDGAALRAVVPHSARQFARAVIMPNLRPPVVNVAQAIAYRQQIVEAVPGGLSFEPLMTLYLTDATPPSEMRRAREAGIVAIKLYPAGATTNSDAGVTDLRKVHAVLEAAEREGIALLVHGEVTDPSVDVFDREAVFIERHLVALRRDFPALKIVLEHITTREGAQFVAQAGAYTAATITAHHLLYNRNAIFQGGLRPHYYCLPVLKREAHRLALVAAATSGDARYFLGTDSAPHASALKEHASGCAGCYTAFSALELYAEAFDAADALDRLEAFASFNAAAFYGLARNTGRVVLRKQNWSPPVTLPFGDAKLKPLGGGQTLAWRLVDGADA
jgi:dihydroorotase